MSVIHEPTADVFSSSLPWRWQWRSARSSPFLSHTDDDDDLFPPRRARDNEDAREIFFIFTYQIVLLIDEHRQERRMTDVNHHRRRHFLLRLTLLNLEKNEKSRSTSDQWCFHHVRSETNARIQRSFRPDGSRSGWLDLIRRFEGSLFIVRQSTERKWFETNAWRNRWTGEFHQIIDDVRRSIEWWEGTRDERRPSIRLGTDAEDILMHAFKTFDHDGKGFLNRDK